MVDLSNKNRPFYEFGVWRGEAFRYLIKTFKKGYGFDTFEGIPEDWHDEKVGTYTSDGNVPKIKGGKFKTKKQRSLFIIMDDCMYDKKILKGVGIRDLFMNGRHLSVTLCNAVHTEFFESSES